MIGMDLIKSALQSGRRVAPSQTDTWHGTPVSGSLWTAQQLATLRAERVSPFAIKSCTVGVQVQSTRDWAMPPETKPILVPILAKTRNGKRAKIVTPAGDKIWKDIIP